MKSHLHQLASALLGNPTLKWLGLGAAVWASGGCLIPQDEDYLSEIPVPRNRPPRIVEKQVQPSERIIRGYGSDLCQLEFSVIVEDPDVDDKLDAYWFVDYDPSQPRGADSAVRLEPVNRKVVRDDRAYFRPPRFGSVDSGRLNTPGDHVVEVVVSDNGLSSLREAQPRIIQLPDGEQYADPGYTTTYVWFVKTEPGGGCQP